MSSAVDDVSVLDTGTRDALRRLILTLADSKRLLGIRYSDWLLGAPSVETAIAASAMAQDEWGHARLLYAMLKDFEVDPMEVEHHRPPEGYASVDGLDEPFEDWAEVCAGIVVVDGALSVALEAFSQGRYSTATGRVPKMLGEEEFHADMGSAWFRRLSRGSSEARERLGAGVDRLLGRTLAWLAPSDDLHGRLVEQGLTESAEALRARFEERVGPTLEVLDVDAAAAEPEREGWDPERGRGPGHPDDDAVERARGDRNRDLFVE